MKKLLYSILAILLCYTHSLQASSSAVNYPAVNATCIQPLILSKPTNNLLSSTGTVQYKIVPGGLYSFCCSINQATLGGTANTITSCTTTAGSQTITTASTITNLQVGQLVGGTGITSGAYITSVSSGTSFNISLPANAAGTVTLNTTAGYFTAVMQSSYDGVTWTNISTAVPKTFAVNAAQTGTANAPGLFTYQAGPLDNYLRWNVTAIGITGVAGPLTGNPQLRLSVDAMDRSGGSIDLPYCCYVAATASTAPAGIAGIMPIDTSLIAVIATDSQGYAGTGNVENMQVSDDDTGITKTGVTGCTTNLTTVGNITGFGPTGTGFSIIPYHKYFYSFYNGTAWTACSKSGVIGRIGPSSSQQSCNGINISSVGGAGVGASKMNATSNVNSMDVSVGSNFLNLDQNATAFAGAGRVNGALPGTVSGGCGISADINATVTALGTASAIVVTLQACSDTVTFTDIWSSLPFTTTQHIQMPAVVVSGHRRWVVQSVGGTSGTLPMTITANEISTMPLRRVQLVDIYAATNPTISVIDGATVSTTLVSTTLNSTSSPLEIDGCTRFTVGGVFTGGTPTTAPVYTLQVSNDNANWKNTTCTFTPTAAGYFDNSITLTGPYRYARLIVSTASSGGTPYGVTYTFISGLQ